MLSIFAGPTLVVGQGTTDEQLAAHYYREGEFDKALLYYERLYGSNKSDDNYQYYLSSLLATESYKTAEKLAIAHSKANPQSYKYKADVGRVLKRAGEESKADKYFDRLIKDLNKASVNQILDLGTAFLEMNDNDRALETYYQGRKQMGKAYPFNFQIAPILGEKGDVEGMVKEYLDVLEISNGYIQSVQNTLNRVIGFEEDSEYTNVLLIELQKKIQKKPDEVVYAEMLIWVFMKQNKYEAALAQVKALDKRNKEDGDRVMELSQLALNNYKYNVAIDGFKYVKAKGPRSYFYANAVAGLLEALKEKVIHSSYDEASINTLVDEYQSALDEMGTTNQSARIINDFAYVKAFYESKYNPRAADEAIVLLDNALTTRGLNDIDAALLKSQLADIYVLKGNIWDASLLYGQVEKKFKHEEIGHEAKLKNALVFYYAGDFGWSQSQLNVLKGSTSKLISNDAVELSAFITENIGIDSNAEALSEFAKVELMLAQNKFDSAQLILAKIKEDYPGHDLGDNILFKQAEIYYSTGKYELAVETYLRIPQEYPFDILVDNAIMEAGRICELELKNTEQAMSLYELILTDHTSSLFVVEARKRFRNLRGDRLN